MYLIKMNRLQFIPYKKHTNYYPIPLVSLSLLGSTSPGPTPQGWLPDKRRHPKHHSPFNPPYPWQVEALWRARPSNNVVLQHPVPVTTWSPVHLFVVKRQGKLTKRDGCCWYLVDNACSSEHMGGSLCLSRFGPCTASSSLRL
jgi:hypothetical protein